MVDDIEGSEARQSALSTGTAEKVLVRNSPGVCLTAARGLMGSRCAGRSRRSRLLGCNRSALKPALARHQCCGRLATHPRPGCQVQLEFSLDPPKVAGLPNSQLHQPGQTVLHHHPALTVPGKGLALLQGAGTAATRPPAGAVAPFAPFPRTRPTH